MATVAQRDRATTPTHPNGLDGCRHGTDHRPSATWLRGRTGRSTVRVYTRPYPSEADDMRYMILGQFMAYSGPILAGSGRFNENPSKKGSYHSILPVLVPIARLVAAPNPCIQPEPSEVWTCPGQDGTSTGRVPRTAVFGTVLPVHGTGGSPTEGSSTSTGKASPNVFQNTFLSDKENLNDSTKSNSITSAQCF